MPYAVEYFREGKRVRVAWARGAQLPVRGRGGRIGLWPWGDDDTECVSDEEPGHFYRWPEGAHVRLEVVKRGEWWQLRPEPVKIAVAAFHIAHTRLGQEIDDWVRLEPGQYLQGALARRYAARRLYIVTVDPPPYWSCVTTPWPRIVSVHARPGEQ